MRFIIGMAIGYLIGVAQVCWMLYRDDFFVRKGVADLESLGDAARKQ